MATSTRQPERSPAERPEEPDDGLGALLAQPPAALEARPDLPEALERATVAALTPHAERLLALLHDRTFGRANPLAREGVVMAVLRLGYPWALQLPPDDLTLVRQEAERVAGEGGRRRAVRGALVAAVVVALLGALLVVATDGPVKASLARLGERAVVATGPPRVYTVPTAMQLVPVARRGELLSQAMLSLEAEGRSDEAITVGLDCLADPDVDAQQCLTAIRRVLNLQAENGRGLGGRRRDLAVTFISMRWDVGTLARPPPATLSYLRDLARSTSHVTAPAVGLERQLAVAGLVQRARAALEVGDAEQALTLGTRCLEASPQGLDCHVVLLTAHDMLWARAGSEGRPAHAEAMERHRLVIATELARAKVRECGSARFPQPLGCQLGIDRQR